MNSLQSALSDTSSNKSPWIDGLPYEFYKTFWNILGPDLLDVFYFAIHNDELPIYCRHSVVTLLPKKGDLSLLNNWRPVSLLCCDYTIFVQCLSNRL
jgi:hypothetical protein